VAWGDRILPNLRPAVKVYVATGRFLPSEDEAAVYAVPDRGLLSRAEANRAEVEDALAGHFGRPMKLRLVLDPDAAPAGGRPAGRDGGAGGAGGGGGASAGRGGPAGRQSTTPPGPAPGQGGPEPGPPEPPEEDVYDWADLEEAPSAVSSPEQRLLEAFPGAEEVQP
jgi:hypothetical protein